MSGRPPPARFVLRGLFCSRIVAFNWDYPYSINVIVQHASVVGSHGVPLELVAFPSPHTKLRSFSVSADLPAIAGMARLFHNDGCHRCRNQLTGRSRLCKNFVRTKLGHSARLLQRSLFFGHLHNPLDGSIQSRSVPRLHRNPGCSVFSGPEANRYRGTARPADEIRLHAFARS